MPYDCPVSQLLQQRNYHRHYRRNPGLCLSGCLNRLLVGRAEDKAALQKYLFALASPGLTAQASGVPSSGVPDPPRLQNTTNMLLGFCKDRHVWVRLLASLPYHGLGR